MADPRYFFASGDPNPLGLENEDRRWSIVSTPLNGSNWVRERFMKGESVMAGSKHVKYLTPEEDAESRRCQESETWAARNTEYTQSEGMDPPVASNIIFSGTVEPFGENDAVAIHENFMVSTSDGKVRIYSEILGYSTSSRLRDLFKWERNPYNLVIETDDLKDISKELRYIADEIDQATQYRESQDATDQ